MTVELRPERDEDREFVGALIRETISLELGADQWPEPMRNQLIGIQCAGRRHSGIYRDAASFLIEADGARAGWLLAADLPNEIRIVEIMVVPGMRGRGVGSAALRLVQERADRAAKSVRLTVNRMNGGAIRLYERLGFQLVEADEVQQVMEYSAQGTREV